MEKNHVKRLPVLHGGQLVGIVTRANLLQAVADLARDVPDPTADDDHIRKRIFAAIENSEWKPITLGVTVRNGIVHLGGIIFDEASRQAAMVAAENVSGVRKVHDHLCWVEPTSGAYLYSAEDEQMRRTSLTGQRTDQNNAASFPHRRLDRPSAGPRFFTSAFPALDEVVLHPQMPTRHIHHKANSIGSGHVHEGEPFLKEVLDAVSDAGEILILGPSGAKTELAKYIRERQSTRRQSNSRG